MGLFGGVEDELVGSKESNSSTISKAESRSGTTNKGLKTIGGIWRNSARRLEFHGNPSLAKGRIR